MALATGNISAAGASTTAIGKAKELPGVDVGAFSIGGSGGIDTQNVGPTQEDYVAAWKAQYGNQTTVSPQLASFAESGMIGDEFGPTGDLSDQIRRSSAANFVSQNGGLMKGDEFGSDGLYGLSNPSTQFNPESNSSSAAPGSSSPNPNAKKSMPTSSSIQSQAQSQASSEIPDHRVRLSPKPSQMGTILGNPHGPMGPLYETNGIIFPYTPVINWQPTVEYSPQSFVHVNQDFLYYTRTPTQEIQIAGRFTAQNSWEARYLFASLHFLRTITKMRFGKKDTKRGLPPPTLYLNGYGKWMFNNLNVIIKGWNLTFDDKTDYVEVAIGSPQNKKLSTPSNSRGTAWVPVDTTISITCAIQQTPKRWKDEFTWDKFRDGKLLDSGGWL